LPPQPSSVAAPQLPEPQNEEQVAAEQKLLMNQHGITFDGEYFHFKEYKYEKIDDAVNYAKRRG